jgi:hypothetical protein
VAVVVGSPVLELGRSVVRGPPKVVGAPGPVARVVGLGMGPDGNDGPLGPALVALLLGR